MAQYVDGHLDVWRERRVPELAPTEIFHHRTTFT